jgi:hypothetical protein
MILEETYTVSQRRVISEAVVIQVVDLSGKG